MPNVLATTYLNGQPLFRGTLCPAIFAPIIFFKRKMSVFHTKMDDRREYHVSEKVQVTFYSREQRQSIACGGAIVKVHHAGPSEE
jgi:hypothetical protein